MDAHILLSPVGQKNRNKIQLFSHRKQEINGFNSDDPERESPDKTAGYCARFEGYTL